MSNNLMIFIIEDEVIIQQVVEDVFADAGFASAVAGSGTEAIEQMGDDVSGFCAVITDIRLGVGPSGWEVAQRARELNPDMPIVYMSGDSSHEWASKGVPDSMMIGKPFAPAQIVTAVSTLLNQVGGGRS